MNQKNQVIDHLKNYTDNNKLTMVLIYIVLFKLYIEFSLKKKNAYLNRLYCLQEKLKISNFFNSHEVFFLFKFLNYF